MEFTVTDERGVPVTFRCADTVASRWTCGAILEGRTYPAVPFVDDVRVALDVGANCGAMAVTLSHRHPDAVVHAFEPGAEALGHLRANTADLPNVVVHPFGLHSADRDDTLYVDGTDIGQASVLAVDAPGAVGEPIHLRSAGGWAAETGIERIDVLKVDVEGCEVDVLESLDAFLPDIAVVYVEYDSRVARRRIAELLEPTHELYLAMLLALDQGEVLYLRKDLADHPQATERLREVFARAVAG